MVSGQDRSSSGAYPVAWAVAEFAKGCAKSRRCRRGDGASRRQDRRHFPFVWKKSAYKSLSKIALDIVLTI